MEPVTAEPVAGTAPARLEILVDGRSKPTTEFYLVWPEETSKSLLRLRASSGTASGASLHAVDLTAELELPAGGRVRASHHVEFDEERVSLFEVYRVGERSLTLVVDVVAEEETVFSRHPEVGAPLRFVLEIQRVENGRAAAVESNELRTLMGEAVSYAFRLGRDDSTHAVEIRLDPVRMSGDLLEIEVEISGRLPADDGPLIVGRRERWIASRGAASTIALESGDPPTGYRFLVTAEF